MDTLRRQPEHFGFTDGRVNVAICVSGVGERNWGVFAVDRMPDLGLVGTGTQVFGFWRYETIPAMPLFGQSEELRQVPNITDTALGHFRREHGEHVSREQIFAYCYAALHDSEWAEAFSHDLFRMLPRIPISGDFERMSRIGAQLLHLHLDYDRDEFPALPLTVERIDVGEHWDAVRLTAEGDTVRIEGYRDVTAMHNAGRVTIAGYPTDEPAYRVCGRRPIDWIARYYTRHRDAESGIFNGWSGAPDDLIGRIRRLAYVSRESTRLVREITNATPA